MRRRAQGFTLIEIMVVIAIIAGLVTTVAIIVPKMQKNAQKLGCQNNLSQLGQVFLTNKLEDSNKAQRYSGVALWLSYRKGLQEIKKGEEKILICPGDAGLLDPTNPEDQKQYDNVDLKNPRADLCSYSARNFKDFPIGAESKEKEIIGTDRQGSNQRTMQHEGGLVCAFTAGDAQFMTRDMLGLPSEADIVIGPEAPKDSILQKVAYIIRTQD